jgi:N-acetylmuramoyl-L-alanine amidase
LRASEPHAAFFRGLQGKTVSPAAANVRDEHSPPLPDDRQINGITLIKLLGSRGAAAVGALFLTLIGGSTEAFGQQSAIAQVTPAVLGVPAIAAPQSLSVAPVASQPAPAAVLAPTVRSAAADVAREAASLHRNGWPLYALVDRYAAGAPLDQEANCMAVAVYHEARGETLEGQLAVARVIMNRAASGKYPTTWCGVVKQPWQFSFVNPRSGYMPGVDEDSSSWRKALGITRLAMSNAVPSLSTDVLWYHANYVSPSWGRRLTRVSQIGAHIFYRA